MPIPSIYRRSKGNIIASYNYTDIEEGSGVITFYGFDSETSAGKTQGFSSKQLYSKTGYVVSSAYTNSGTFIPMSPASWDFDSLVFNFPRTVYGTGYFNGGFKFTQDGGSTSGVYYATFTIKQVSATGAETTIAAVSSDAYSFGGAGSTSYTYSMPIAIPLTVFKKGDKMRITVSLFVKQAAGSGIQNYATYLYCDPMSVLTPPVSTTTTKFIFHCPFRIDL